MLFKYINYDISVEDTEFDRIYPEAIYQVADIHFTPIEVCKVAAQFLVSKEGDSVLDIGSGAGKFCMVGSVCTEGVFIGVEKSEQLHTLALQVAEKYDLKNLHFINGTILDIDFKNYNAFYYFNSFYETICPFEESIEPVEINPELYTKYCDYVKEELDKMPIGTKLATYIESKSITPASFKLMKTDFEDNLKLWEKIA